MSGTKVVEARGHRVDSRKSGIVAADVRRLTLKKTNGTEPPHVGCYGYLNRPCRGHELWLIVTWKGHSPLRMNSNPQNNRIGGCLFLTVLMAWVGCQGAIAETFFTPTNATWKMFKGLSEASSPDPTAWRQTGFDTSAWTNAPAPIFYSTALTEPPFFTG